MLRSTSALKSVKLVSGEEVTVGRSVGTGITSLKCSRRQLCITFHDDSGQAGIVRKGFHASFLNGEAIGRQNPVFMKFGDRLQVLRGKYEYELVAPEEMDSEIAATPENTEATESGWRTTEHFHVFTPPDMDHRSKIGAFDLDGTVISTKSGRVFPKDEGDWQFKFPEVTKKLRLLHNSGYKIVIFTNQKGILTGKQGLGPFQRKIAAILSKIPAKVQVFVSPGRTDYYRKPLPGMWEELENHMNGGITVKMEDSFYVGDAAGRQAKGNRKKDFSCSDRLFAANLNLKFFTPEEYFLDQPTECYNLPEFLPSTVFEPNRQLLEPSGSRLFTDKPEMVVMVGYPGSGKSHFVKNKFGLRGYQIVNRDTLKSWQKCVEVCRKAVQSGISVVVDNTNPDKESRKRYIDVAKENKVICRCFCMNVSHAHALHNVKFRSLVGTDKEHKDVNEMVMNSYKSKFEHPNRSEGFDDVVKVNFMPDFDDKHLEMMYKLHLLEK